MKTGMVRKISNMGRGHVEILCEHGTFIMKIDHVGEADFSFLRAKEQSMKPPISYYGGKARTGKRVADLVNQIPHSVYVEPFCGSAAVFWLKHDRIGRGVTNNNNNYFEIISDTNSAIINLFQVMRDHSDQFIHKIINTPYARSTYEHTRNLYDEGSKGNLDPVTWAWATYCQCMMTFSHKIKGGWAFSLQKHNHVESFSNSCRYAISSHVLQRLRDVNIENTDFHTCMKQWDSPDTLFYCDPPYVGTSQGHYKGFSQSDLDDLIIVLKNLKGKFILSGYPNEVVPKEWPLREIRQKISVDGRKETRGKTECIWVSPDLEEFLPHRTTSQHMTMPVELL